MKTVTQILKYADLFPDEAKKLAQRLHVKKDEIPFVRKFFTSEKSEVEKEERAVVSYISTTMKDRDGEQLLPNGVVLDNYRKNPVVLYSHDYRSVPIAKNIWIKADENGLIAKTVFAKSEFADQIYKAYTEDIGGTGPLMKAWSVGFIPVEYQDIDQKSPEDPKRIYSKWELLEYSAVPVPSCPEALTLAIEKGMVSPELQKDFDIEPIAPEPAIVEDILEEIEAKAEVVTKPETTENYHRIPVDSGDHGDHRIRTITISDKEGIKALYCGECKKVITYLFSTDKWTMEEAKKWVADHKEGKCYVVFIEPEEAEVKTEAVVEQGPSDDYLGGFTVGYNQAYAELKEGRVLSTKNRELVKGCADMLLELYNATEPSPREEPPKEAPLAEVKAEEPPKPIDQKAQLLEVIKSGEFQKMVNESVRIAWAKLRGKVE